MATRPITESLLWRKRYMPRRHSSSWLAFSSRQRIHQPGRPAANVSVAIAYLSLLSIANARVKHAIDDIRRQINDAEKQSYEERDAHDGLKVERDRRLQRVQTDARPVEHAFDEYGAAQRKAEQKADGRRGGDQRVFEHVLEQNDALRNAAGTRHAHEVLLQRLQHIRAQQARREGDLRQALADSGQD